MGSNTDRINCTQHNSLCSGFHMDLQNGHVGYDGRIIKLSNHGSSNCPCSQVFSIYTDLSLCVSLSPSVFGSPAKRGNGSSSCEGYSHLGFRNSRTSSTSYQSQLPSRETPNEIDDDGARVQRTTRVVKDYTSRVVLCY
jgi:hypothetical protein